MSRVIVPLLAGLALLAMLAIGATSGFGSTPATQFSLAQPPPPDQQGQPAKTHPLPPELEFLRTMSAEQQFDSVLGAQVTFVNPQGEQIVVNAIPGTVTAVTATELTLDPNGPAMPRTFNVTQDTLVAASARRGTLTVLAQGDRAVVFTVGDSPNASAIVEPRFAARGMHWMMRGDAMDDDNMDAPMPAPTPGQ